MQNIICFHHDRTTRDVTHFREERRDVAIRKVRQVEALKTPLRKIRRQRNAVAEILLTTYYFIEHFFAGHIYRFTVVEHETYYCGNPTTQLI